MLRCEVAESRIVHHPVEDFLVTIHAIDEEAFQHLVEDVLEVVEGIGLGGSLQGLALSSRLCDLIEEQLVCVREVRAEAIVYSRFRSN